MWLEYEVGFPGHALQPVFSAWSQKHSSHMRPFFFGGSRDPLGPPRSEISLITIMPKIKHHMTWLSQALNIIIPITLPSQILRDWPAEILHLWILSTWTASWYNPDCNPDSRASRWIWLLYWVLWAHLEPSTHGESYFLSIWHLLFQEWQLV